MNTQDTINSGEDIEIRGISAHTTRKQSVGNLAPGALIKKAREKTGQAIASALPSTPTEIYTCCTCSSSITRPRTYY
ncbi:hypothetical protein APHWI1_0275 [Anaplasma phagocytophilum str. ApWI1]|uniref:Uncharacterized protein n=3 Tax=Anaplasma phagocytophilum TaxID=948 RepID=Q2GJU5_ANAPZ|nr:hypothetical protein [Anaplasma phagocytophilum]ABD43290.1 hypothetical protein APH_0779 [Anaplasma phagocytophilum str. HZ]AGR79474.1 hypothetical protein YYU_03650 [Anaplasma phagocytophilum str. HZ2]AGR80723.1 hypothetical protein WSQ_03650 [Anaplasma phagocytophilum str. JM]AGR81976.1 hypothetical protein YYY_03645 [Anaplasma phagocytophilum str. Dog2]EOA61067.1 hypothetical protein HGE1_03387 [Anaplasma phagocytophilum str. HGE1]KJV60909.1 hypothetical protein APHWEB_1241 [Anaplasma p